MKINKNKQFYVELLKIKSKTGKTYVVDDGFVKWFAERFEKKGFKIENKYAFVRGFTKRWKDETIKRWIDEYDDEQRLFLPF